MALESQNNEQKLTKSDAKIIQKSLESFSFTENQLESESKKNDAENAYVERIITEATQQDQENLKSTQSIIMIPESQEKMAGEIRTALGLSFEVTLNSAIKYALFHAQNQGIPVCKLKEYPSSLSSYAIKVKVTPDTWYRLKESNAIEQLSECAVTGIELLHKQLISVKKNSDEHS